MRVQFTPGQSKAEQLAILQKQYVESIAYETTGLTDIVKHCTDWPSDTKDFGCWSQYQNIDENPELDLPGARGGLGSPEMYNIPFAANFLEIFAIPSGDGTLTVRLIAGSGYAESVRNEFIEGVCSELLDAF